MTLNTSGIRKASYSATRMIIASCKWQGFWDLLAVRCQVTYRKIDLMVYFNVVKQLPVWYNESLTLFDQSESSKLVKVLKVS